MADRPALTIVATLYKSEEHVVEFCQRSASAAKRVVGEDFELILVDDGSPDGSLEVAKRMLDSTPQLRVLELSRNFGHHPAIIAGLDHARGDLIFLLDSDLEEAPELLIDFHGKLAAEKLDVVYGSHERSEQSPLRRITGNGFWRVIRYITNLDIPRNPANIRLMRRAFVEALTSMPDRNVFLGGMFVWPGFRQAGVLIKRTQRVGESTYSWQARVRLAALAAVAFSDRPLYFVFWLGLSITAVSILAGSALITIKLINPEVILGGFTSLMVSIWTLGGIMIGSIGVVGFYIAHIYEQTRARPRYIVRSMHRPKA